MTDDDCPGRHGVGRPALPEQHLTRAVRIEDTRGEEVQAGPELGDGIGDRCRALAKGCERLLTTCPDHRLELAAVRNPFGDRRPLAAEPYETDSHHFDPEIELVAATLGVRAVGLTELDRIPYSAPSAPIARESLPRPRSGSRRG